MAYHTTILRQIIDIFSRHGQGGVTETTAGGKSAFGFYRHR